MPAAAATAAAMAAASATPARPAAAPMEARSRRSARRGARRTPRRRRPRDPCPAAARPDLRPMAARPPCTRLAARSMPLPRARRPWGPNVRPCARRHSGPIPRSSRTRRQAGPISGFLTGLSRSVPGSWHSRTIPGSGAGHSGPVSGSGTGLSRPTRPAWQHSRQIALPRLADPGTISRADAARRYTGSRPRRATAGPGGPANRPARAAHAAAGTEARVVRTPDPIVAAVPATIGADGVPAVDVDVHAAIATSASPVRAGPAPEAGCNRHAGAEHQSRRPARQTG